MEMVSRHRAARALGLHWHMIDRMIDRREVPFERVGPTVVVDLEALRRIARRIREFAIPYTRAAEELGIGPSVLRRMIDRGEIRAQRIGGQLRISQAAIDALQAANGGIE